MRFQLDYDSKFNSGFVQFDAPCVFSAVELIWALATNKARTDCKVIALVEGGNLITLEATADGKEDLRVWVKEAFDDRAEPRGAVWNIDGNMAHLETP